MNVNGAEILDTETNTALTHTTLRLRWAASEKRLYAEYDPDGPANGDVVYPTKYDLANGATNWNLNPTTGSFMILLYAGSENRTVTTADNLWFDNFKITDGNQTAPPVARPSRLNRLIRTPPWDPTFFHSRSTARISRLSVAKERCERKWCDRCHPNALNVQLADDNSSYRAVVFNSAGSNK